MWGGLFVVHPASDEREDGREHDAHDEHGGERNIDGEVIALDDDVAGEPAEAGQHPRDDLNDDAQNDEAGAGEDQQPGDGMPVGHANDSILVASIVV